VARIFHPLLALIASATDRELARYVEYLKQENRILRARIPGQVHTTVAEREKLLKVGRGIGRAIEELISIVKPTTFYRWMREADQKKPRTKNPKGGQRKPRELRELVLQIARTTGFGYTRIIGELRVDGGRKWRRRESVAAVEFGGAQPCLVAGGDDGGVSPDHPRPRREAEECDPICSSGETFAGAC